MASGKKFHKGPRRHSEPKAKNLAAAIFAAVMILSLRAPQITRQNNAARDPSTRLALLAGSG
jgi:hypothetical protein